MKIVMAEVEVRTNAKLKDARGKALIYKEVRKAHIHIFRNYRNQAFQPRPPENV